MISASVGVVHGSLDWSNCSFDRRLLPPGGGDEPKVSSSRLRVVRLCGPKEKPPEDADEEWLVKVGFGGRSIVLICKK